jgi:spermidine synthase
MSATPSRANTAPRGTAGRLLRASALVLFLELGLIRWLGSNIVHLSYFSNFVLLGSFLGIGLGFLVSCGPRRALPWSPWVLGALVVAVHLAPVQLDQSGSTLIYFSSLRPSGPPLWVALPLVFLAVAATLVGPAEAVGRCFALLPPLTAYRLDLLGSLIGIGCFTALSYLDAPPVAWGMLLALGYVTLLSPRPGVMSAASLVVIVAVLALESLASNVRWSPYYKITTQPMVVNGVHGLLVAANGVPHQLLLPADEKLAETPQYGAPYAMLSRPSLANVLIVGAGTGSDVAIALKMGARHVDAVEIDPVILELGRANNPDRAYRDPRVTTHIDDGRAFLERTHQRYDLVLFALPDSLALVNGASTVRLESFLFTAEAVRSARSHLTSSGGFAMYNFYRESWLIDRLAGTVRAAFGHDPCVSTTLGSQGLAVIAASRHLSDQVCQPTAAGATRAVAPATDDHPFPYFRGSTIPGRFLITLGLVLLVSLVAVRSIGGPLRTLRPYRDLFFMGTAFLLLETRNVATFALLFGTTWIVNALVFTGILLAVLAAVEVTRRIRPPDTRILYLAILCSLALGWLLPNGTLLWLPVVPRAAAAMALAFAPVFFANVAFATRFAATSNSQVAFAVNLLGAMVGGCLEYGALLTGYRNLLLVIAGLYLAAFVLTPRSDAARPASISIRVG